MKNLIYKQYLHGFILITVLFFSLGCQSANAFTIKWVRDGSWDQMIFNPLTGSKIGTITVPHFKLQEIGIQLADFTMDGFELQLGSNSDTFLTGLGGGVLPETEFGDQIGFDNTMIPGGSGFTSTTNSGTNFAVDFDSPFLGLNDGDIVDLSGLNIFVSTPLDLNDPSMVQGFVVNDLGGSFSAEVSAVPVPAAIWLLSSGLIGLIGMKKRSA